MARSFPSSKPLKRNIENKKTLLTIYIICEGSTEKDYFEKLAALKKNTIVKVDVVDRGGPILTLIEKCIALAESLEKEAKRSKDSFANNFTVWGAPDVDDHPNLTEAMNLISHKKNLNIALSNPCFEIWGIFHYRVHDGPIDRHNAQRLLRTLMDGYCHETNPYFDKNAILNLYEDAIKNSKRVYQNRIDERDERGNPSSSVHDLAYLIVNGKLEDDEG